MARGDNLTTQDRSRGGQNSRGHSSMNGGKTKSGSSQQRTSGTMRRGSK